MFTSLLTIPAFNNMPLYAIAVVAAFITSMTLVVLLDYRTPEQKAAARARGDADAPAPVEPRVIVVGDVETNQAKQWVAALGGETNIASVEPIAETRVRVQVLDSALVDAEALRRAGLAGVVEVSPGVWHLVAGLEAEQYAEGMRRRLASVST